MTSTAKIETYLDQYSTVVLSDMQQYGERCAARAVVEAMRMRGLAVSLGQVRLVMAEVIVMPAANDQVEEISSHALWLIEREAA